jgi:CheY-like chemotaxis protein
MFPQVNDRMASAPAITVLVVDDDEQFARVAADLLRHRGYCVVGVARSAAEALAACERLRPNALLVDVRLPDGNGLTLAAELVSSSPRPNILLTSSDRNLVSTEALRRSGADGFVAKAELARTDLERFLRGPAPMSFRSRRRLTGMTTTHTLETAGGEIVYDVHGPLPTAEGRPPVLMIGQPMTASGFGALASQFHDSTVVTYDPRGLGRSSRSDGRVDNSPTVQASDVHGVIEALGAGPVEMFASSGGAVTALALVAAHPDDVVTLVAHEPPLILVLPDADGAARALAGVRDAYASKGHGAGMAAFIAMGSWQGEFTNEYFALPPADPAAFGFASVDDGSRDDPLLSDRSAAVTSYRPDVDALVAAPTRIVIGLGEESEGLLTGRTARATAALLGQQARVFPSHHGGFLGAESGYPGQPEAFARKLREIFDLHCRV